MSNLTMVSDKLERDATQRDQRVHHRIATVTSASDADLAASITRAASQQTYFTIRFLVDRDRVDDAYRAYAYFRWLDDSLDTALLDSPARLSFVDRQQTLINNGYQGHWPSDLSVEERLIADLIRRDEEPNSGLQAYIRHMLAVMAFDANRQGRLISQQELADYTNHLAVAVTEAMHYFIGHNHQCPHNEARYFAVSAAHITHMLRDTCEDVLAGYLNIATEFVTAHHLDPRDIRSESYRAWVKERVQVARTYFAAGTTYLAQASTWRCRLAGYAYTARFTGVLDAIEREGYLLRPAYPERKHLGNVLKMSWAVLSDLLAS